MNLIRPMVSNVSTPTTFSLSSVLSGVQDILHRWQVSNEKHKHMLHNLYEHCKSIVYPNMYRLSFSPCQSKASTARKINNTERCVCRWQKYKKGKLELLLLMFGLLSSEWWKKVGSGEKQQINNHIGKNQAIPGGVNCFLAMQWSVRYSGSWETNAGLSVAMWVLHECFHWEILIISRSMEKAVDQKEIKGVKSSRICTWQLRQIFSASRGPQWAMFRLAPGRRTQREYRNSAERI